MSTQPLSPSRRDLILMTGVAAAGAAAATRGAWGSGETEPSRGAIVINVRDHGARGDGLSDDSDPVMSALRSAEVSGRPASVYFPRGIYKIRAGILRVPDGRPMIIRGDGPHATEISLFETEASSDPLVALDATFSAVENVQLDGGGARSGGDLLVMNSGYNRVSNCNLSRAPRTAIAIGQEGRSIAHVVENVIVRDAYAYGIRVHGLADSETTGSTDGLWTNVDVGRSGLSGVFLESSSQNLSNVHVWQSGVRGHDSGDQHGFRTTSRTHIFSGCQAEKNLGSGFFFENGGGEGCLLSACRIWENGWSGLFGEGTRHLTISGSTFVRNGRNNVGGAADKASTKAAAIVNDNGDAWSITGCSAWDDRSALAEVWVPPDSDTPGIPSRTTTMSQTFAYVETGSGGGSSISGGILRAEEHLSGRSIRCNNPSLRVTNADLGRDDVPVIEAADTLAIPPWAAVVRVSGSTQVRDLSPGHQGRVVTLIFDDESSRGLTNGGGVRMRADYAPTPGSSITLVYAGAGWREQSRS